MLEILVVDDNEKLRDLLSRFLRARGHRVWEAKDGQEAVNVASRQPVDLVLMDVRMPNRDGLSACQEIRGRVPSTKVILLTGYRVREDAERILKDDGNVACLQKPFTFDTLSALMERMKLRDGRGRPPAADG